MLNNKLLIVYNKAIEIVEENKNLAKKRENIIAYGSQYIGSWDSDNAILKIFNDGTYTIHHYSPNSEDGQGVWDCTSNSITFTRTKGVRLKKLNSNKKRSIQIKKINNKITSR